MNARYGVTGSPPFCYNYDSTTSFTYMQLFSASYPTSSSDKNLVVGKAGYEAIPCSVHVPVIVWPVKR